MMLAAVYHKYNTPIQIQHVPIPTPPRDGVVLAVKATGVCRSDWHGWKGHDDDITNHGLPFIPGHEVSGTITAVGPLVTKFKKDDRVAVPFILSCGSCRECERNKPTVCERQEQPGFTRLGSFAEYVALPRADRNLCVIPEGVSFLQAAAMGCRFTTAYRAVVQQGEAGEGKVLAVFGCGGVGLSCVMIGVACGARVIAVDVSLGALRKAKELGAWKVVDASRGKAHVRGTVNELTGGVGADVTIDAAGFAATCESAVWCTRRAGRMVQVGLPIGGDETKMPVVPMGFVAGREIEIVGSHGFAAVDMPKIIDMVVEGKLDPGKLVEREVTLEQGAKAIEDMDNGSPMGITMVTKFRGNSHL